MKLLLLLYTVLLTAIVSTPVSGAAQTSNKNCYSTQWPHEFSSLQPDPSLHFGRLENGFRYILKNNPEPRDRVGVYLNVEAGSIYEQESERGLAHFLEHLLFNGTIHFKPGELIEYFQSIGMSFGGDVNAYTSYTDTVYKLNLPTGTSKSLDQALLVMRDYADGALLLEEEIDRERGVILAEKTSRNSAGYRSRIARTSFVMENTLLPVRQPIGTESVIKNADRDDFNTFYKSWYRPDNMVLVMVGDFSVNDAETLIDKHFSSMSVHMDGECPTFGSVEHRGVETFYHHEPETGATEVYIETVRNKDPENDSIELQVSNLHRYMTSMIINHRIQRLQESVDTPFSSAAYYDNPLLDRFQISGIKARTKKESWREALARIDEVLKQALHFGFLEKEVERVKKELLVGLQNSLLGKDTRNSLQIINQIIAALNGNRVLQSPEQEEELFGSIIERITVRDLNESLRNSWHGDGRMIQVVGDAELTVDDDTDELKVFYTGLADRTVEPPEHRDNISFPYLSFPGETVEPEKITDYADIGVRRIDYKNGLIVNIKQTDFKKNQVSVVLNFGNGRASVPAKGLDMLASSLVNGSGTATLTKSQLDEALSGNSVHVRFRVGEEAFAIEGQAISSEAELLLQVVYTMLKDPGFRPDEYLVAMKNFDTMYRRLEQDINGAERLYLDAFFTGDAKETGLPDWEQFKKFELDDVVDWLTPAFLDAPLELSIVGDIDTDALVALAGKYFASLPGRKLTEAFEPAATFPAGEEYEIAIDSTIDKALVKYGWLTDDFSDNTRSRRLHVLAVVFEERLRRKMRDELGKAYSPTAYSVASRIYPGYGAIYAEVVVDRASIDIARNVLAGIGSSFVSDPVDEIEVERAREPIVTSLKDTTRTNGYWLHSVMSLSSRNGGQLVWPTTLISDFDSITSDQINELARTYIRDDRRGTAIIQPESGDSGGGSGGKSD